MVDRDAHNVYVAGSIPAPATNSDELKKAGKTVVDAKSSIAIIFIKPPTPLNDAQFGRGFLKKSMGAVCDNREARWVSYLLPCSTAPAITRQTLPYRARHSSARIGESPAESMIPATARDTVLPSPAGCSQCRASTLGRHVS